MGSAPGGAAGDTGLDVSGDTYIDRLRHALYQVESSERGIADAIVLHPLDWASIEVLKTDLGGDNTGDYVLGDPASKRAQQLWDCPIIPSFAMSQGKFLAGGFGMGCQLRDVLASTIDISDSHSDYFAKNLLAIRCESRTALVVTIPELFVYGSL